jgi:hypothetical protein
MKHENILLLTAQSSQFHNIQVPSSATNACRNDQFYGLDFDFAQKHVHALPELGGLTIARCSGNNALMDTTDTAKPLLDLQFRALFPKARRK